MARTSVLVIAFFAMCCGHGIAQPGPPPSPWSYGPSMSIFYNNGEVDIGTPTGAGTLGIGWVNVSGGYAVNGAGIPGAIGSQPANRFYASPNGMSGTPVFRSIANGDLPSSLAIPGTLSVTGATSLVNVAISGTLSVAGTVSGSGFTTYLASPPCIGCTTPAAGHFTMLTTTSPFSSLAVSGLSNLSTYSVGASGMVGDGTTINNTAFQAALTAVAGGGFIHLPCGVFKITAGMLVTISSGAHITLEGSGICTQILSSTFSGIALAFEYTDDTSSVDVKNIWMVTDTAAVQTAIRMNLAVANTLEAYSAPNVIENVFITGNDYPGPTLKQWNVGIIQKNVGNVAYNNVTFIGGNCSGSLCAGTALQLVGRVGISYGTVANIVNSNFNLCAVGISYGDWFQDVSVTNTNMTGVNVGIMLAANPTGVEEGLAISNSNINYLTTGLQLDAGTGSIANVYAANNIFLPISGSTGNAIVLGKASNFTVIGNQVNAPGGNTSSGIGIVHSSTYGVIADNTVVGQTTGIYTLSATVNTGVLIANNPFNGNTNDFSIGAGSSGYTIVDPTIRTIAKLFACIAGIEGSTAYVSDTTGATAPTYHLTVAGSGSITVHSPVFCNGTAWQYD